ncbi:MAG: Ig-like domain-containing protein [Lachnospiraceae bacterium]|nr:Ig-like domain-containing protein [Lachnospiraceae bacterium]
MKSFTRFVAIIMTVLLLIPQNVWAAAGPDRDTALQGASENILEETGSDVGVTGVTVTPEVYKMAVGDTAALKATVTPENATDPTVKWSSTNIYTVSVNAAGVITANKTGKATITAKTVDGEHEASCVVTVIAEAVHVSSVTVSPAALSLYRGDTSVLTATIEPSDATYQTVTWTSSNPAAVSVDEDGNVTALKAGYSVVRAETTDGGHISSCSVTVKEPVTDITISPSNVSLRRGYTEDLKAVISPSDATDQTVTWTSSDTAVATVDSQGIVTAVDGGTAVITAKANGGRSVTDTCTVTVGYSFTPPTTEYTLLPGESRRLELNSTGQYLYGVKWQVVSSSPSNCVTVKNGIVTAKNLSASSFNATAVVSATHSDFGVICFDITVDRTVPKTQDLLDADSTFRIKSYKISARKTLTTNVGVSRYPKVTVSLPKVLQGREVKYTMHTTGVCEIGDPSYNKNGSKAVFEILPLEPGATYVTWSVQNAAGRTASACTKIIVKQPVYYLDIEEESLNLAVGAGQYLTVFDTMDNTNAKDLSFSVKGKGLKVSKSGYVMGTVPGVTGTVTVKCGSVKDVIPVTVDDTDLTYVCFTKPSFSVKAPKLLSYKTSKVVLKTNVKKKDYSMLTWKIPGNPEGLEVVEGTVYVTEDAVPGSYIVKATSSGYNTACCELIVK